MARVKSRLKKKLQSELHANERVLWASQPKAGRYMLNQLIDGLFAITIIVAIIAVLSGVVGALIDNQLVWLLPLFWIAIFAVLLVLHIPQSFFHAQDTLYAITNKRIIVIEPKFFFRKQANSYGRRAIKQLKRRHMRGNSGNLYFTQKMDHVGKRSYMRDVGFEAINDVPKIERLIMKVFRIDESHFWVP